jgi:hypothetical protein
MTFEEADDHTTYCPDKTEDERLNAACFRFMVTPQTKVDRTITDCRKFDDLFNEDFPDFIDRLHKAKVEHILIGGYANSAWLYQNDWQYKCLGKKSLHNYSKLKNTYQIFGASIFKQQEDLRIKMTF